MAPNIHIIAQLVYKLDKSSQLFRVWSIVDPVYERPGLLAALDFATDLTLLVHASYT